MPRKHQPQDPTLPIGFNITFRDRFWKKVTKSDGCWLWIGGVTSAGRGAISCGIGKRQIDAHVGSWIVHFGAIPEGQWVLHTCDNGLCVRPDHLWLGNVLDNSRDCCVKRRHPQKLSWEIVGKMRVLYRKGTTTRKLAEMFNASRSAVWRVVAKAYPKHKPNDAEDIPPPVQNIGRTRMPSGPKHHAWKHGKFSIHEP